MAPRQREGGARRRGALIVLGAAAVVATLAVSLVARACSCASYGLPELVPSEGALFRGEVVEMRKPLLLAPGTDGELSAPQLWLAALTGATHEAVVHVDEVWAGALSEEVVLDLGDGLCCNCTIGGARFDVGDELLVYAYERDDGTLDVSSCMAPMPIADAGAYLVAYGPGERTLAPGRTGARPFSWGRLGLGLLIGLGALALVVRRTQTRGAPT